MLTPGYVIPASWDPAPKICTSDLRSRVVVQRSTDEEDGAGGTRILTWATVATVSANVRQMRSYEAVKFGSLRLDSLRVVTLRKGFAIAPTDRVVIDGVIHRVIGLKNFRNQWIEATTEADASGVDR